MSHFSAADWYEFVGGPATLEGRESMQRHLEEGCAECRKASAFWIEVLGMGGRESRYAPPAAAVRLAKAAFVSERSWRWLSELAQAAQLVFDSLRAPAPAEVRGSIVSTRQFLQESKPFMIDLRLECEAAAKMVRLSGQVLNSDEPDKDVAGVDVFLLRGEHLATKATANKSGEFDLHFQDEEGLQLFLDIPGRKVIEVWLPVRLAECDGVTRGNK